MDALEKIAMANALVGEVKFKYDSPSMTAIEDAMIKKLVAVEELLRSCFRIIRQLEE